MQDRSGGDSEAAAAAAAAAVGGGGLPAGELRRELHTALGTAKWQVNWLLSRHPFLCCILASSHGTIGGNCSSVSW